MYTLDEVRQQVSQLADEAAESARREELLQIIGRSAVRVGKIRMASTDLSIVREAKLRFQAALELLCPDAAEERILQAIGSCTGLPLAVLEKI